MADAKRVCLEAPTVRLCKIYNETSLRVCVLQEENDYLATWTRQIGLAGGWVSIPRTRTEKPNIRVATLAVVRENTDYVARRNSENGDLIEDLEEKIAAQRKELGKLERYYDYMENDLRYMTVDLWTIIAKMAPILFTEDRFQIPATRGLMEQAHDDFDDGFGELYQMGVCHELLREANPAHM
jgi:hypothetical protein